MVKWAVSRDELGFYWQKWFADKGTRLFIFNKHFHIDKVNAKLDWLQRWRRVLGQWMFPGFLLVRRNLGSHRPRLPLAERICKWYANSRESSIQRQFFPLRNHKQAICFCIRQQKSQSISRESLFNMTRNIHKDRRQRRGWQRCANFKKNSLTQGKFILWSMVKINF